MSFTSITVTGSFKKQDGTPAAGRVTFQLSSPLVDSSTNEMRQPVKVDVTLDPNGAISTPLTATNDPTTIPAGATYIVTTHITDAPRQVYSIAVPYNSAGGTLDLADAVAIAPGAPSALIPDAGFGFAAEPTTRWERIAAGVVAWFVLGLERLKLTATEFKVSASLLVKGPRPWADIVAWGADPTGVAAASAYIQDANDAVFAAGGGIVWGIGMFNVDTTISPSDNVTFAGGGENVTEYHRNSNIIMFDVRGTAATHRTGVSFRDLRIESTGNTAWTNPLVRSYYVSLSDYDHVTIAGGGGEAIRFLETQDANFYDCRFDSCGSTDGTRPAVHVLQDDTAGGFSSAFSNNNLWFVNCVWESNESGHFWSIDPGGPRNNKIYLVNCKMENAIKVRGDFIHIEGGSWFNITNLNLYARQFGAGAATAINMIYLKGLVGGTLRNISFEAATPSGARTVQRGIYLDGAVSANSDIVIDGITGSFAAGNVPDAFIVYAGTNNRMHLGPHSYTSNPGAAPLRSGTPTTTAPSARGDFEDGLQVKMDPAGAGGNRDSLRLVETTGGLAKHLRVNVDGSLEILNNAFSAIAIFLLSDSGDVIVGGNVRTLSDGSVGTPAYRFYLDPDTGIYRVGADSIGFAIGAAAGAQLSAPADTETALLVRRNVGGAFSLQRVSMGATDSGGAGFKVLRVPN